MSVTRLSAVLVLIVVCGHASLSADPQESFRDATAITQFQRAADAYAFQHRQIQRRLGEGADQAAMAAAIRAARPSSEGEFFTPMAGDAFRRRIAARLKAADCTVASGTVNAEVPRVGVLAISTDAVPACLITALPRLPEELEYRIASVALILLDTHANIVVDVLHGAFRAPPQ